MSRLPSSFFGSLIWAVIGLVLIFSCFFIFDSEMNLTKKWVVILVTAGFGIFCLAMSYFTGRVILLGMTLVTAGITLSFMAPILQSPLIHILLTASENYLENQVILNIIKPVNELIKKSLETDSVSERDYALLIFGMIMCGMGVVAAIFHDNNKFGVNAPKGKEKYPELSVNIHIDNMNVQEIIHLGESVKEDR